MVADALAKSMTSPAFVGHRKMTGHADWSCFFRRSPTTLRLKLILSADFERCVFPYFFQLIVYVFPRLLRCVWGFGAAFNLFVSGFVVYDFPSCVHIYFLVNPILSFYDLIIVQGGERYSAHEQDLPPWVKWTRPTNENFSRTRTFILASFRSNVRFGKSFSRSSSRAAGDFSPRRVENSSSS